jgi:hypothetical protein
MAEDGRAAAPEIGRRVAGWILNIVFVVWVVYFLVTGTVVPEWLLGSGPSRGAIAEPPVEQQAPGPGGIESLNGDSLARLPA